MTSFANLLEISRRKNIFRDNVLLTNKMKCLQSDFYLDVKFFNNQSGK